MLRKSWNRGAEVDNEAPPCELRGQSPFSVGVDVLSVAEVAAALDRFGHRYVERVFTPRETAYCRSAVEAVSAARFAARFAAKEAAVKALQPEHRWTDWRSIEVHRPASGCCELVLHGDAAALAARRGIHHLALSMSHEGAIAAAVVVALRGPRSGSLLQGTDRHA